MARQWFHEGTETKESDFPKSSLALVDKIEVEARRILYGLKPVRVRALKT